MQLSLSYLTLTLAWTLTVFVSIISADLTHHRASFHFGRAHPKRLLDLFKRETFTGRATWWDPGGGQGNCAQKHTRNDAIVAMNGAQWKLADCFKWVTIHLNQTTTKAQIVDQCPDCPYGALDMSPAIFSQFYPLEKGIFQMSWEYTDPNDHSDNNPFKPKNPQKT